VHFAFQAENTIFTQKFIDFDHERQQTAGAAAARHAAMGEFPEKFKKHDYFNSKS
jgi:hypothetical protein